MEPGESQKPEYATATISASDVQAFDRTMFLGLIGEVRRRNAQDDVRCLEMLFTDGTGEVPQWSRERGQRRARR